MNKKEILVPFLVIGLALLFAGICFAVFLSNGKSKKWVTRKMRVGAMLLSLTAISSGSGCVTCYDQPNLNTIHIDNYSGNSIVLYPDNSRVLTGTMYDVQSENYSFLISDNEANEYQKDEIIPADGNFDSQQEQFTLEIDSELPAGSYRLRIYSTTTLEQVDTAPIELWNLYIESE